MARTLPLEQFRQIARDSRCEYKHQVNQYWSHSIISAPTRDGRYTMPDTRPSDKGKDNADWWRELSEDHRA